MPKEEILAVVLSGKTNCFFVVSWQLQDFQSSFGSPSSRMGPPIIGAEDEDFDGEQEQVRI